MHGVVHTSHVKLGDAKCHNVLGRVFALPHSGGQVPER